MTLYSLTVTLSLTLFALLFSLEEGCTCASVSMCVWEGDGAALFTQLQLIYTYAKEAKV